MEGSTAAAARDAVFSIRAEGERKKEQNPGVVGERSDYVSRRSRDRKREREREGEREREREGERKRKREREREREGGRELGC
jgi:hypothetical protein